MVSSHVPVILVSYVTSVWGEFLYLLNGEKVIHFIGVNTDSVSKLCYLLIGRHWKNELSLKHSVLTCKMGMIMTTSEVQGKNEEAK